MFLKWVKLVKTTFLALLVTSSAAADVEPVYKSPGDVNIIFIINSKGNTSGFDDPYSTQTLINSAIWTSQRLNFLEFASPLSIGLTVYKTEKLRDNFKIMFNLYQDVSEYNLGVIHRKEFSNNLKRFSDVLKLETRVVPKYYSGIVKAAVIFLNALDWSEHVTILAPDGIIIEEFNRYTRRQWICVTGAVRYGNNITLSPSYMNGPIVFFGDISEIYGFLEALELVDQHENQRILFAPLDGSIPDALPEKSYVIIAPQAPFTKSYQSTVNILPTPLLFEVAHPIIAFTQPIQDFILEHCNDTASKLECFTTKYDKKSKSLLYLNPHCIIDILKIEPLKQNFIYNIYRVENSSLNSTDSLRSNHFHQPLNKIFSFNIFSNNLTLFDLDLENNTVAEVNSTKMSCRRNLFGCLENCRNFQGGQNHRSYFNYKDFAVRLRPEPWILAFLSVSALGILFCISIMIFFLVCLFRRDILEGNPVLTIILLISVMFMYCAVIPICLEGNSSTRDTICILKFLSITLSYSAAFSLILSRSILLATASKEIGFMSHVAGPVQSFLCLFIFGVQAALSIQIIGQCSMIFNNYAFLLLMSYNIMLILLMLCLTPLIYRSQRNYREGKYFTVATCLIACAWSFWLTVFILIGEEWMDPMLCLGLVSTASIIVGAIFIPRTYRMTIAAARNRLTSTFPSLATATSTLDIYRAHGQPVYDCVNVATINAVNTIRNITMNSEYQNQQQPDLYTCPNLPTDDDFDIDNNCPPTPPISSEKVTRF